MSAGAESRNPLSEHPVQCGLRRRCGQHSGFKALIVCVFWRGSGKQRGDGQDTTDLNKVLRESQSHLPLNPEKLHKHMEEEGTR